jgi:hypothetical protein
MEGVDIFMLFKRKKKEELKFTTYWSLFFYPDEQSVYFDEVFRLAEHYDVSIKDMMFRSGNYLPDGRHMIRFGFYGTFYSLRDFERELQNSDNEYFKKTFSERL